MWRGSWISLIWIELRAPGGGESFYFPQGFDPLANAGSSRGFSAHFESPRLAWRP